MTNLFNQEHYDNLMNSLRFDIKQSDIFMSNKYFDILIDLKNTKKIKTTHLGFVYAYMYLQTYMCRNTTYDYFIPSVKEVKELLGYSPIQKTLDYLIKKDGILDSEKLTITDNNFPLINQYKKDTDVLEFDTVSNIHPSLKDHRDMHGISNTTKYKYPVLSFYEDHKSGDIELYYGDEGGTFFDISNTTNVRFEIFAYCMANEDIGDTGFYLYSYIKHMNDFADSKEEEYKATAETISKKTGLSVDTVKRYLKVLRQYNLITGIHNMEHFVLGLDASKREPNTYISNDFEWFLYIPQDVDMMKVKTRAEYYKKKEEETKELPKLDLELL